MSTLDELSQRVADLEAMHHVPHPLPPPPPLGGAMPSYDPPAEAIPLKGDEGQLEPGTDYVVRGTVSPARTLIPNDGTRIFFEPGSTLDGRVQLRTAIASNAKDVKILGSGKIRNFRPINQHGVIEARIYTAQQEPAIPQDLGTDWLIEGVQVSDSTGYGVVMGERTTLRRARLLRLEHGGFTAHGGDDSQVVDTETAFINVDRKIEPRWEAGNKIKYTKGFRVKGLYAHDINGSAFWPDIENEDSSIVDSIITDICGPGIQYELSTKEFGGVIDGVFLKRCGRDTDPWMFQAAIQIQNVRGVAVSNVHAVDCFNGVSVIHQGWRGPETGRISVQSCSFDRCGQSGVNWEGGEPTNVTFNDIEWRLGLSQFSTNDDAFRAAFPFRYGGGFESINPQQWIDLSFVTNQRFS